MKEIKVVIMNGCAPCEELLKDIINMHRDLCESWGLTIVTDSNATIAPRTVVYDEGAVVGTHYGYGNKEEFLEFLESHGVRTSI